MCGRVPMGGHQALGRIGRRAYTVTRIFPQSGFRDVRLHILSERFVFTNTLCVRECYIRRCVANTLCTEERASAELHSSTVSTPLRSTSTELPSTTVTVTNKLIRYVHVVRGSFGLTLRERSDKFGLREER